MKNIRQNKKLGEMKTAWLVQWGCHDQNKEKVIDVISARNDFDKVVEIAKDIYRKERLSLSEKVYLAGYKNGREREKEFFSVRVPIFTHYQSDLYRNLMKSIDEKGLTSKETQKPWGVYEKYPQYVSIGHNPYLEIVKVFNLSVCGHDGGNEILEWDRPLVDGSFKKEKYECKK